PFGCGLPATRMCTLTVRAAPGASAGIRMVRLPFQPRGTATATDAGEEAAPPLLRICSRSVSFAPERAFAARLSQRSPRSAVAGGGGGGLVDVPSPVPVPGSG